MVKNNLADVAFDIGRFCGKCFKAAGTTIMLTATATSSNQIAVSVNILTILVTWVKNA